MISTIVNALLPVLFMLVLGYGAGKFHAFPKDGVDVITTLVLDFALPAGLFVSTVTVAREALLAEGTLFLALFLVIAATWGAVFGLGRVLFRHNAQEASLQALLVALAAIPFYGLPVMTHLFGSGSAVAVSIGSIIVNLVPVPATTVVLALGAGGGDGGGADRSVGRAIGGALLKTAKAPYVVVPVIAVVLVLIGVRVPSSLLSPLRLAGNASSGVGLFVAGLTLAAIKLKITRETAFNVAGKLILMPALFVGIATLVGADGRNLEQGVLLAALPCGPLAVLLGTRYKKYETEASTSLAVSTLGFVITLPIALVLLHVGTG